jgi:hypothetical protein
MRFSASGGGTRNGHPRPSYGGLKEIVMLTVIEESARAAFIATHQSLGWVTEQTPKRTPIYMTVHTIRASKRCSPAPWVSGGPGMSLKRHLKRRLRDAAGVVRDRRRGDRGDYFEEVIFAETSRQESFDVLIAEEPAFLDHRFRQSRQRGKFAVLWQTTVTNSLHIRHIDPLLKRKRRMEGDGPCAGIGHRVGEQHDLDLLSFHVAP